MKLNLGCGYVRPKGWINTDSSLNAHLQRIPFLGQMLCRIMKTVKYESHNVVYMNLNRNWPFSSESVDVVYASHLFEHLSLKSVDLFLKEAYRTLKPGGVMRLVVPDLYQIAQKYVTFYNSTYTETDTTKDIMWAINMHREGQYGHPGWFKKLFLEMQGYPHQHKYMYDDKSLTYLTKLYGFRNPRIMSYGVSEYITDIKDLEGSQESYLSVYLEILK